MQRVIPNPENCGKLVASLSTCKGNIDHVLSEASATIGTGKRCRSREVDAAMAVVAKFYHDL